MCRSITSISVSGIIRSASNLLHIQAFIDFVIYTLIYLSRYSFFAILHLNCPTIQYSSVYSFPQLVIYVTVPDLSPDVKRLIFEIQIMTIAVLQR